MSMELRLGGLRFEHRHGDGSWGVLEPRTEHHSSVDHDPERTWAGKQLFVCVGCDEEIRVRQPDGSTDTSTD